MAEQDEQLVERVKAHLDELGATYEIVPCDPELADTAAFCEHYGYAPERCANAILVASKKEPVEYVVCLVLATTRLDVNKTVRKRMGVSKASFAPPEVTRKVTGMAIGGVTPFGLPEGLRLWVDTAVAEQDWVIVGAGSRTAKVRVEAEVFGRMEGAETVEIGLQS